MEALSELFDETRIVVPCDETSLAGGLTPIKGNTIKVVALSAPKGSGLRRKLNIPMWLLRNGPTIWREVRGADAVHTPIPGDAGTIGMLLALLMRKPLLVRHCGNWFMQRTLAERFWKWSMEYFAGGRNVMLATGGSSEAPSRRNPNLKWIFSTSLRHEQMKRAEPRELPSDGRIRLVITCRQEIGKGTDVVIESLPTVLKELPNVSLDVVGDGSYIPWLKKRTDQLGLKDKVHFHGRLAHSGVIDVFRKGHLFCYPTSSEGFPKVVLEALASGMPVITTRVSVLPKLIGSDCGVLLDSAKPEELASKILDICSNPDEYRAMSLNAIGTARQYCLENWRDFIGETLRTAWKVDSLSGGLDLAH